MPLRASLRALSHRNFQLFFAGQSVSLIGTWMQQLAMGWLVYVLTDSSWWLGVVTFVGQIPAFFLAPVAGVVVDRWNRHRLILLTQTLAMVQAFALAALALTGVISVWQIVVLAAFIGIVNPFDMTARQAFLTEMIGRREDLANAIALNSSMVNGARLVGPALAGVLLARTSPGVCFLGNGLSYLAVLAALLAMRVSPRPANPSKQRFFEGLREGITYAFGFAPIRSILLLLALVSLAGMSYSTLLPVLARRVFHGEAGTLALLTTASGVGALAGAITLAVRRTVLGLGRWIAGAPGAVGLSLLALSWTSGLGMALALLAVIGFFLMVHMASSNTILQTIVDEDKRGRVMSLYTVAFMGMAPLGSLLAGALAERTGVEVVLRVGGVTCLAGSVAFVSQLARLRALVRPLYQRLGILPEMASAVHPVVGPPAPAEAR